MNEIMIYMRNTTESPLFNKKRNSNQYWEEETTTSIMFDGFSP